MSNRKTKQKPIDSLVNVQLVFKVPSKETPGFARRMAKALEFKDIFTKKDATVADLTKLIEFLSDYVEGDKDRAVELLWDASQDQFMTLLTAISGGDGTQPVPPKN